MVPLFSHFLWHCCLFDLFFCLILNKLVSALSAVKSGVVPSSAKTGSYLQY